VKKQSILIIKLGALGDFIQALGPLAAIRGHHPDQSITLLTSPLFEPLARASGLVDFIQIDPRPRGVQLGKWLELRRFLINSDFERVYDLQTSDRSSFYYTLFFPGPKPDWSGIARGCSHPHTNPNRDFMHTVDRQREQLNMAGIDDVPKTDLTFADADLSTYGLPEKFGLFVPGGAAHRPEKRWPVPQFKNVARQMSGIGIVPVIVGTKDETNIAQEIVAGMDVGIDLTGKTDLLTLAALAKKATLAIGNDTGPMHMMAAAGCPSIVLFSDNSNPDLCAPRGDQVRIIHASNLADLPTEMVIEEIQRFD
jgi:ADP-heptose:LPS heptosyltransferase